MGSGIVGMDEAENQDLLSKFYRQKMNEYCTLNFVPVSRMSQMVEKYVNNSESHGLETFFDHEVFRAAYTEIKKSFLDMNLTGPSKKSYKDISEDIERKMRERVRTFLKKQFVGDEEEDEELKTSDMAMLDSVVEQQKQSYQSLKK